MSWSRNRKRWPWHDFLTAEETAVVLVAESDQQNAKIALADATARLNPIRNRAIHRAKYAALKAQSQ